MLGCVPSHLPLATAPQGGMTQTGHPHARRGVGRRRLGVPLSRAGPPAVVNGVAHTTPHAAGHQLAGAGPPVGNVPNRLVAPGPTRPGGGRGHRAGAESASCGPWPRRFPFPWSRPTDHSGVNDARQSAGFQRPWTRRSPRVVSPSAALQSPSGDTRRDGGRHPTEQGRWDPTHGEPPGITRRLSSWLRLFLMRHR